MYPLTHASQYGLFGVCQSRCCKLRASDFPLSTADRSEDESTVGLLAPTRSPFVLELADEEVVGVGK